MDRFQEQTTFANAALAHLRGDDDAPSYEEDARCGNCGAYCQTRTQSAWEDDLLVGPCCQDGGEEPACECTSDGGDLFDPRDCEIHNSASPWNHRMAAIETRGERATKGAA